MTEAMFRSWVRSQLRKLSQKWKPLYSSKKNKRLEATDIDRERWSDRIKYVWECEECKDRVPDSLICVDHIVPCGSLRDIEKDAGPFLLRMLCEEDGFQMLCKKCHKVKTMEEKAEAKRLREEE